MTAGGDRLSVAFLGDRGIPARYSGFSTLVEEVSTRLVAEHDISVTVYCRAPYFDEQPPEYRGVKLVYLSAPGGKSFESLFHSGRAILHSAMRRFDAAFVVDPGNSPLLLPLKLTGKPVALHTDGLGWQRSKWSPLQQRYYRWSEWLAARLATWLVTDCEAMADYYRHTYGSPSSVIPYGSRVGPAPSEDALQELGLEPDRYHLVVARLEPENNVAHIIDEYARSGASLPLVYVGTTPYESAYAREVMSRGDGASIRCVGGIFDARLLNSLYRHCRIYIHGHEVGGTNPSLLRAMGAGAPCLPIDVVFHRETLGPDARYFPKAPGALATMLGELEADRDELRRLSAIAHSRASELFRWDAVADGYATLLSALARARRERRPARELVPSRVYHPEAFASHGHEGYRDEDPCEPESATA